MFAYLRFRWQLCRSEREERKLERSNDAEIKAAKERHAPQEETDQLGQMSGHIQFHFQEEIQKLHSQYLLREAYRLIVPYPEPKELQMWERDEVGHAFLSQRGINVLRAAIRAERKARVELFLMWLPGVVGILGALIGLVSILASKK